MNENRPPLDQQVVAFQQRLSASEYPAPAMTDAQKEGLRVKGSALLNHLDTIASAHPYGEDLDQKATNSLASVYVTPVVELHGGKFRVYSIRVLEVSFGSFNATGRDQFGGKSVSAGIVLEQPDGDNISVVKVNGVEVSGALVATEVETADDFFRTQEEIDGKFPFDQEIAIDESEKLAQEIEESLVGVESRPVTYLKIKSHRQGENILFVDRRKSKSS
ncbi:MAG TPA: hypothetical protein VHE53_04375 [Patescibacteria group bacterium]|nr:hypothetical protein [Patescibacteria group bacterium]